MHIASMKRVAQDLIAERIPEAEQFRYLITATMLNTIYSSASSFGRTAIFNETLLVYLLFNIAVILLGSIAVFRANAAGDNRAFLVRYVCLSLPASVITILLRGVLLVASTVVVAFALNSNASIQTQRAIVLVDNMLETAISIYFFALLIKHVRRVSMAARTT